MAEPIEPPHPAEPPEDFFLRHLPLIERIAASFARRRSLSAQDQDEFASWVKEKLLEDHYRRIRAYQGRCQPERFLAVTVGNLGKDFLDKLWQRWRPCIEAQRRGPVAVLLDQLLNREGLSFDQACEVLRSRYGVTASREDLEDLYKALPHRAARRIVGEDDLLQVPVKERSPEEEALASEEESRKREAFRALQKVARGLPADDRLLLRLLYGDGHSIADVARVQKTDQKSLYRRRDKILRFLHDELRKNGWGKDQIAPLL